MLNKKSGFDEKKNRFTAPLQFDRQTFGMVRLEDGSSPIVNKCYNYNASCYNAMVEEISRSIASNYFGLQICEARTGNSYH